MNKFNNVIPDISVDNYPDNPTIHSPNSFYELPFYQNMDTTINTEDYKRFLENAIRRFRMSPTYKIYKGKLMELGLDRCQVLGNITSEMADIEMHHCILTIFDVTTIISNHMINTQGKLSTFDLVELLKYEHTHNNIPLCMLAKTPHQLYHNNDEFYVSPRAVFGNWFHLLEKYHTGITMDIAFKILFYLKRAQENGDVTDDAQLLKVRDTIYNWAYLNNN